MALFPSPPASRRRRAERSVELFLKISASVAATAILVIGLFVAARGLPLLLSYGPWHFVSSSVWQPDKVRFGIFPMIIGSLAVTGGALVIAVPLGVATAAFLAELAPARLARLLRPAVDLLAGIPSVVYGFVGLTMLVPWIRETFGGPGFSVLAGSLLLGVMVLPTVVAISEDAIRAVPRSYREGSLALGATPWQTLTRVVLPAARPGIVAAAVLGMGRAIGETMAVLMVTGNVTALPNSPLAPTRTLTANIALEMGYASGRHQEALFATGIVLFVLIMALNTLAALARRKEAGV
ncbi:MAG: phosphate ABC transporter permease subunit PstC [Betaproteobacteria bacterium]